MVTAVDPSSNPTAGVRFRPPINFFFFLADAFRWRWKTFCDLEIARAAFGGARKKLLLGTGRAGQPVTES